MMVLYGITSLQTFIYYTFYIDDGVHLKTLVASIWLLDTLHIVLVCHTLYYYLVVNYNNPAVLGSGIWSLWLSVLVNCIISCVVQGFFTVRLHSVMGRKARNWMIPLIATVVVLHFAFGAETAILGMVIQVFTEFQKKTSISAVPFAVFAVVSDFLIAGSLCVTLQKTRSYFMTTNNIINQLMIFSINRCLLTAGAAVIEIILFSALPDALWYLALDFVIGKLYANSLLASLNTRHSIRGRALAGSRDDAQSAERTLQLGAGGAGGAVADNRSGMVLSTVIQMGSMNDMTFDIADAESLEEGRHSVRDVVCDHKTLTKDCK